MKNHFDVVPCGLLSSFLPTAHANAFFKHSFFVGIQLKCSVVDSFNFNLITLLLETGCSQIHFNCINCSLLREKELTMSPKFFSISHWTKKKRERTSSRCDSGIAESTEGKWFALNLFQFVFFVCALLTFCATSFVVWPRSKIWIETYLKLDIDFRLCCTPIPRENTIAFCIPCK